MSDEASGSKQRPDGRAADELRTVTFKNNIAPHATGSTLIEWGDTRVICCATIEEEVPRWMKAQGRRVDHGGYYLPYSALDRRDAQGPRSMGARRKFSGDRSLMRAALDLQDRVSHRVDRLRRVAGDGGTASSPGIRCAFLAVAEGGWVVGCDPSFRRWPRWCRRGQRRTDSGFAVRRGRRCGWT